MSFQTEPHSTAPLVDGEDVEVDLLELWVSDIPHTQHLLTTSFGFTPRDTTVRTRRDEQAVLLANGAASIVLRQGTRADSPVSRHVATHGDTIADVALVCADPDSVADRARANGVTVFDHDGTPAIDLFGNRTVCHSLRRVRVAARGPYPSSAGPQIRAIDHVAYCLPSGWSEPAALAYETVLGLQRVPVGDAAQVGGDTGMRSVVLRSGGGFTVVLTEPVSSSSGGQTQRFLDAHAGPGVQHAAFAYDDLAAAVEWLRSNGVGFLAVPDGYYSAARRRLAHLPIDWDPLMRAGILVDADERGLLFQLFTTPLSVRGTFFAELIQRAGAVGFGANNVRALFEALDAAMVNGQHPTVNRGARR
jgi:4-hydroxymandelate synthase